MKVKNIFNMVGTRISSSLFFIIAFSLAYSIVYTVGPMLAAQDVKFDASQLIPFVLCFVVCIVVNILIFTIVPHLHQYAWVRRISQYLDRFGNCRYFFLFVWAFIFLLWIPAYLIFYPSILSYDIQSQVGSALGQITNNHHPVLHTWLLRFFMKLGNSLFSSYEWGIGLMALLQMLILSYALARLVCLLKKKGVPMLIVMLIAFLSGSWFMNACLSVSMIKDSLHAAFLVLFVCHFTEIATEPLEYSLQKKNLFILPIVSFLMCAFRNNGIHIYIFSFACLIILRIAQIKKVKSYIALIVAIVLPILGYSIYTGPFFTALDIAQGEVREALSIPIQQLQRVAVNKTEQMTNEQTELMNYYIDNLEWREWLPGREYDPFISDPAKSCFYSEHYSADPIAFWKFYFQTGKQFSKEYLVSVLSNTLGYWYPGFYGYSYVMYEDLPSEVFVEPLERKSIWDSQTLMNYYKSVCSSNFWRQTPLLRLFFVPGFTLWFLLYSLALSWKKRGFFKETLPIFLPLIGQYGIMLLSPMSSFRYAWPFYLMLPLVLIGIYGDLANCPVGRENESHNV